MGMRNNLAKKRLFQYLVAIGVVLVCLLATTLMQRMDQKPTLFVFLGAVMVAAAVGGLGPGLLAVALSALISAYYVLTPAQSFQGSWIRWLAFQLIGLLIVSLHASRRAVAERLSATDQRLRLAMDAGRIGVWDYAIETNALWISDGLAQILNQDPKWFKPTFSELLAMIHAEDRELFHQTVLRTITDRVDYEVDFRIHRPDGSMRWFVTRGRGYIAATSGEKHVVGVISESSNQPSQAQLQQDGTSRASERRNPVAVQQ